MSVETGGWRPRALGRAGIEVSPLGLGASYGVGGADVERAFERGVSFFYWGARRRARFAAGLREIAKRHRDRMVVVVQSYARSPLALRGSLEVALRRLKMDRADILLLGWWDEPPPERILDAAMTLREAGKVGALMVSCHNRRTFATYVADPCYGAIMCRYNAAHRGAEREVFPRLDEASDPPGVVAYTATRWGTLLDPALIPDGEPAPRASDCYRFALSDPHVDVCLSGPRNGAELDEALCAIERGPMSDDELAWMRRVGRAARDRLASRPSGQGRRILDRLLSATTGRRA